MRHSTVTVGVQVTKLDALDARPQVVNLSSSLTAACSSSRTTFEMSTRTGFSTACFHPHIITYTIPCVRWQLNIVIHTLCLLFFSRPFVPHCKSPQPQRFHPLAQR